MGFVGAARNACLARFFKNYGTGDPIPGPRPQTRVKMISYLESFTWTLNPDHESHAHAIERNQISISSGRAFLSPGTKINK